MTKKGGMISTATLSAKPEKLVLEATSNYHQHICLLCFTKHLIRQTPQNLGGNLQLSHVQVLLFDSLSIHTYYTKATRSSSRAVHLRTGSPLPLVETRFQVQLWTF